MLDTLSEVCFPFSPMRHPALTFRYFFFLPPRFGGDVIGLLRSNAARFPESPITAVFFRVVLGLLVAFLVSPALFPGFSNLRLLKLLVLLSATVWRW